MGRSTLLCHGECFLLLSSLCALWVSVLLLFIQYNVAVCNTVDVYKSHKVSSFEQIQPFLFFTQIMRNSEYIKTNIKNFKDKRTSLPWYIVYLLLQYKTRKRWTQVLFININHYICLRLILSCKIDTLLLTKSQSPSQFYNFQKVQMRNM